MQNVNKDITYKNQKPNFNVFYVNLGVLLAFHLIFVLMTVYFLAKLAQMEKKITVPLVQMVIIIKNKKKNVRGVLTNAEHVHPKMSVFLALILVENKKINVNVQKANWKIFPL